MSSARGPATPPVYAPGMDARSTRVAEWLAPPLMVAAALTLPAVAIAESRPGGALEEIARILNWGTWLAFVVEFVVMLAVVPDRRTWVRHHPLDLVIVLFTPPVLPAALQGLRGLQMLRLLRLLRLAQLSRRVFSLEGLRYAALLAILTAVGGGAAFVAFERPHQDLNAWEGTYWAVTTMTTLGSQFEPTTTGSEILSTFILVVGIGFVALLTGAFAQRFLAPDIALVEEELEAEEEGADVIALRELRSLREQLAALEVAVQRLAEGPGRSGGS